MLNEQYGGIELKRNAKKNTYLGFIYSIGLHALLILLYLASTLIVGGDKSNKALQAGIGLITIDPWIPPTSSPASSETAKFNPGKIGIPIPVPNVPIPNQTVENNASSGSNANDTVSGTGIANNSNGTENNKVQPVATTPNEIFHPNKDNFIPITEDAHPVQNIQSLIEYPEVARHAGLEGRVIYTALIGVDGRVIQVDIEKSDYEIFKQAVIDALLKARFTPALQDKNPVEVWYSGIISFSLNRK